MHVFDWDQLLVADVCGHQHSGSPKSSNAGYRIVGNVVASKALLLIPSAKLPWLLRHEHAAPTHSVSEQVGLPASSSSQLETLFAEELGLVVEVHPDHLQAVQDAYRQALELYVSCWAVACIMGYAAALHGSCGLACNVSFILLL